MHDIGIDPFNSGHTHRSNSDRSKVKLSPWKTTYTVKDNLYRTRIKISIFKFCFLLQISIWNCKKGGSVIHIIMESQISCTQEINIAHWTFVCSFDAVTFQFIGDMGAFVSIQLSLLNFLPGKLSSKTFLASTCLLENRLFYQLIMKFGSKLKITIT